MGSSGQSVAFLALVRNGRSPWPQYLAALREGDDARRLLEREHGLLADELLEDTHREIERWRKQRIQLLTILDPEYPQNLAAVHDHPPLIFLAGDLAAADTRTVAVIGSRRASGRGLATAGAIAESLVDHGFTVASGLAAGVDTAAHMAALESGGRTIAVIGTGLVHCYPPENRALQHRIACEGAVISQFWPDDPPRRQNFPLRNAVMSGMSLATVVVEARETSGARIQARLALGHGRPVLLMESLLDRGWARELSERPGVHVIGSPSEVPAVVEHIAGRTLLT